MSSPKTVPHQQQQQSYSDTPSSRAMRFFDVDVDEEELDDNMSTTTSETEVHDQLPTVEEIKAKVFLDDTTMAQRKQRNQQRFLVYLALSLLCAISLIGLIWIGSKRHRAQAGIVAVTETVRITPNKDVFRDKQSPQSRALYWMMHQDPLQLPLPTQHSDPFVQRYIVATFIFAVMPSQELPQWQKELHLLSRQHECSWNAAPFESASSSTVITMGFSCENGDSESDGHGAEQEEDGMRDRDDPVEGLPPTITAIVFPLSSLQGELPPELQSLKSLKVLNMDGNQIEGHIPVMPSLQHLSLSYNALTGYLSEDIFSEMTRLKTLKLAENALQGSLPNNFAALTNLKVLALQGNELTAGLERIYPLTSLEEIYLSYNSWDEHLSNGSFQKLEKLKVLDMKSNRLAGPLPDALWSLSRLEVIDFHHNALDGHINDVIMPNHPLKFLDVSSNIMGGGLPPSIANLRHLTHLDVSYNRFEVVLPDYLGNLTKIKTLLLTENDMFGPKPLPSWLRGLTDLQHLSFRLTSRTGTIPTWFGELTKLELVDLDWNHISGTIPSELGRLTDLKYLMLNRNVMNGKIPVEVSSLPNLHILMVDNNGFSGELDACQVTNLAADCGDPDKGCPDCNSDTQRIACPCCTTCCYDGAQRCNMQDWIVQVDDEFRGGYDQYSYDSTMKEAKSSPP